MVYAPLSILRVMAQKNRFPSAVYQPGRRYRNEQLMAKLKKAGLVKSIRGAGGGYRLAKDAAEVSVGDVLRALEGDLEPATCAALHSEDSCEIQGSCITKYVWKKVNESMAQTVDSIMINTLVEMNKEIKKEGQKDE